MKKSLLLTIVVAILVFFVLVMQSGKAFKHLGGAEKDFPKNLKEVTKLVKDEQWDTAYKKLEEVEKHFDHKAKWLQISEERDRIEDIARALVRAKEYIYSKDKGGSLAELRDSLENWKHIGG